jgi:hypothetical protein
VKTLRPGLRAGVGSRVLGGNRFSAATDRQPPEGLRGRFVIRLKYRPLFGIAIVAFAAALGRGVMEGARQSGQPSDDEVQFAQTVADLLQAELFAALITEFNETTPDNMEHGKQAISLIFNDLNRDIWLVGTFVSLGGENNEPDGRFECEALKAALSGRGHTDVQKVKTPVLPSPRRIEQYVPHRVCALPHQLRSGVVRRDEQPRPMG